MSVPSIARRRFVVAGMLILVAPLRLAAAERPPAIPFETATVDSVDGRRYTVSWHAPLVHHVAVYAGSDPNRIGRQHPVGSGDGDGNVVIADLPAATRWYFALVPDRGRPLVIADRSLHLTSASNFRDVGGYRTAQGHWVRVGLAYRSNGLEHLESGELATLDSLGLKLVCDLRTDDERARGPDRVPSGVAEMVADVMADNAGSVMAAAGLPNESPGARLAPIYRAFVTSDSARQAYHRLFERLADRRSLPTVFHCTAGKDRTGWAAAVLLTLLGVPHATVVDDYQLTGRYLHDSVSDAMRQRYPGIDDATWKSMLAADPAYLESAFDEVTRRYGSFDRYLRDGLSLDAATLTRIRRNFLSD